VCAEQREATRRRPRCERSGGSKRPRRRSPISRRPVAHRRRRPAALSSPPDHLPPTRPKTQSRYASAVKAQRAGDAPAAAAPKPRRASDGGELSAPAAPPPSHAQRKIVRKAAFLDRVAASAAPKVSAGGVAKKRSGKAKARPLPELASLASVLDADVAASAARRLGVGSEPRRRDPRGGAGVNSARQRRLIVVKETARMAQVLAHPQYRADPLAAITHHLNATLPPPPPEPSTHSAAAAKAAKQRAKRIAAHEAALAGGGGGRGARMDVSQ